MNNKTEYEVELMKEAFQPVRKAIDIQIGAYVKFENLVYKITESLDFNSVIGKSVETGRSTPLFINKLSPVVSEEALQPFDLNEISDEDWQIAQSRFFAIKPLLEMPMMKRTDVQQRAKEVDVDTATLYRWINKYNSVGVVSALTPKSRGWTEGKSRISALSEAVIKEVIHDSYLTKQRSTPQKTVIEVLRRCQQRGIEAPHATTIRARIAKVTEKQRLRGRGMREQAKNKFSPVPGSFPNADYPLAVIQIDHTPADIILVDDYHRKPIGRPWITLAIDVYSRMIVGYYLAFDPPSETSVAMCVAHSVLPKDEWLLLHKVDAQWPVWGIPKTIHVDNGADFRSDNFKRACLTYGINLEYRPVRQPRYGGHVERVIGTLMHEIHDLPGTTFSSVKDKGEYNSEKEATMTMAEFETWLVSYICNIYHQRMHSGIGMTPLRKWEIGIFGNTEVQGAGLPARPADRHTVLLDFLPSFRRTIQTFGVTIDNASYYADVLRQWINAEDPEVKGKKREFIFRRDPRDISTIWFYDPDLAQYFKIPFADQSLPSVSFWEYQQARESLKREGNKSVNAHQVLLALTELRTQVDESKEKSKKARRASQRRKVHEQKVSPAEPLPATTAQPSTDTQYQLSISGLVEGDLDSFGDIA
jgi:putative transposase